MLFKKRVIRDKIMEKYNNNNVTRQSRKQTFQMSQFVVYVSVVGG